MVKVNTVYQTVLALADKDQGGYITPQEFNLFANHAQNEIFEQYFYDLSQFKRLPGNKAPFSDAVKIIEDKLAIFIDTGGNVTSETNYEVSKMYRPISLTCTAYSGEEYSADMVTRQEQHGLGPLMQPVISRPIFYRLGDKGIQIRPNIDNYSSISFSYYRKPEQPNWTYIVSQNSKKPLYNLSASDHQDFELHPSEEKNLVHKILQLAGISVKDFNVAQFANAEEVKSIQQEKS